jgi:ELWxxDGT repeat protein
MLKNNSFTIISMVLGTIGSQMAFAQNGPTLVQDLHVGTASSDPHHFFNYNSTTYFTIADASYQPKWMKTDGTAAGTLPVQCPLPRAAKWLGATHINEKIYLLLLEPTQDALYKNIVLATTDFTTTTILDTFQTHVISADIKRFSAQDGKLMIIYRYTNVGPSGSSMLVVHNGNQKGILLKEWIESGRGFKMEVATYTSANATFIEENYDGFYPGQGHYKAILPVANVATGTQPKLIFKQSWYNTPAANLFKSFGVTNNYFLVSIGDTLTHFTLSGTRTNIKTGIGNTKYVATIGNQFYFANHRNELWKTDGSAAGTVRLNPVFETPNELITNILGGGAFPYLITQSGTTTRTYYLMPQGTLSRVGFKNRASYFQPFVSNGVQYIFSRDSINTPTHCPIFSLVRYGQTEAQSKTFELRDKTIGLCDSKLPSPVSSIIPNNNLIYYGMTTNLLGTELWKLDLKNTSPIKNPSVFTNHLNAMVYEQKVKLDWVQATDSVAHFEVQKLKQDGSEFETIHSTIAESSDAYHRSFDELPVEGVNEYRLKTVSKSGKIGYSPTQKVDYQNLTNFTIFPNPTNEDAFLNLKAFEGLRVEIAISDLSGKVLLKQTIENASPLPQRLHVSKLEKGTYLVHIQSVNKQAVTRTLYILN